jgi:hypothetical protein
MAEILKEDEDEAILEVFRLAANRVRSDQTFQQRILAMADELGISQEAVLAAEKEYHLAAARKQKLARLRKAHRAALYVHSYVYAIVNLMLVGINFLTYHEDRELWVLYPVIAWGAVVLMHLAIVYGPFDWNEAEPGVKSDKGSGR